MDKYLWVKNPKGKIVEIEASRWKALEKEGYQLVSAPKEEVPTPYTPPERTNTNTQADINYVCQLWANNGMGRVGEEILLALDRMGLKINLQPIYIKEDGLQPRTRQLLKEKYDPSEVTLLYAIPQVLEKYHTAKTYLKVPWDTTRAPDEWVKLMNQYCTKVFPDSHFTREVFEKSGVKVPMETIKDGVDIKNFPYLKRNWDGTFTFFTCGDLSVRKGTDVLFSAFQKAFPKEKDVRLIVKSNYTMSWGRITVPKDDRIEIIEKPLLHEDFLALFKRAHCFVFPSRSEGFGLPVLEAMATGLPAIFHNWSGLCMMTNDAYNYPFPNKTTIPAPAWHYPPSYSEGNGIGDWGEPDEEKLIELMRFVYQNRSKAKTKGDAASKWVRESWDWDTSAQRMWHEMKDAKEEKSWGEFYNKDTLTTNNVQACINSHKELFWLIHSFYPKKVREDGCGTAEMIGWLSWPNQEIEGKKTNTNVIQEFVGLDLDEKVIDIAKTNLHAINGTKVKLVNKDAFTYYDPADLIFSQGMLEHFSDIEMKKLVDNQLKSAPVVIHSVPNNDYGKLDFGNERLMSDEQYYKIFHGYNLTIYRYWKEGEKKTQSILVFKRVGEGPKVSLIMPVFNQSEITKNAIEAAQKHTNDYELIVVDNNSNDGIEKWLDKQEGIRVIHVTENLGVPKAKNLALAASRGEYICFLDNDTIAGEGWLENLLDVFKDPTIGFTAHEGYIINKKERNYLGEKITKDAFIEWASGSVFLYPRKLIPYIGLLLDYDLWCVEDVDYCCRIRQQGYRGRVPETPTNIVHLGGQTAEKFNYSFDWFNVHAQRVWKQWGDFINSTGFGLKIDIGVGEAPAIGYLHVDVQPIHHVDIVSDARSLPFKDGEIEEVRNAHLIEHFTQEDADGLLKEWNRVLMPNGTLRIICPDFRKICRQVTDGSISLLQGLLWTYGGHKDKFDFHYWGYDADSLKKKFEENGFANVQSRENENGWLEVTGNKKEMVSSFNVDNLSTLPPSKDLSVGVYITHHHTYGGGENMTFQVINMLQKQFPKLSIMSDDYDLDIKNMFGIDLQPFQKVPDGTFDVFLNISHFKLLPPKGKKNIAFIFYPQYDWLEQLKDYQLIVTLSEFVRKEIQYKWNRESLVCSPATNVDNLSTMKKKKQIIAIGRFFHVEGGNNKNQLELVKAFKQMPKGWKLIFIGTVQNEEYLKQVQEEAKGFPIEFIHDIPFTKLKELLAESSHLWHAAGYMAKENSSYEHFGMIAVEALASGCQPVVYNAGGIVEIPRVETWNTIGQLIAKTVAPPTYSPELLMESAKIYAPENISKQWWRAIHAALER